MMEDDDEEENDDDTYWSMFPEYADTTMEDNEEEDHGEEREPDEWYVSNVSIIFDAPCLFLHHLHIVSLHFVALLCIFRN
jgi:hypothetical protein